MLLKNHTGSDPETTWAFHVSLAFFSFPSAIAVDRQMNNPFVYCYVRKPIDKEAGLVSTNNFFYWYHNTREMGVNNTLPSRQINYIAVIFDNTGMACTKELYREVIR